MLLLAKALHTSMMFWQDNEVQKFGADAILFREIKCKKMDIFMFKRCYQCVICWNQVNMQEEL